MGAVYLRPAVVFPGHTNLPSGMTLLAVDLGLRTGLASYSEGGRLLWYRSQNFGSRPRLKNGAVSLLKANPETGFLVVEGGGDLAPAWQRAAEKAGVRHVLVDAHTWRQDLLLPREQRDGPTAKQAADRLARRIIDWSEAPRPTSLRHDAAEAILVGLWAVLRLGWLAGIPAELR